MATSLSPAFTPSASTGMKRQRGPDDDDGNAFNLQPQRKHARPTFTGPDDLESWQHDSVISTPTAITSTAGLHVGLYQRPRYDSDDHSSMMSERGSPEDMSMSSPSSDGFEDDEMLTSYSHLPDPGNNLNSSPWRERVSSPNGTQLSPRVPTPFGSTRSSFRSAIQTRPTTRIHVRQRHPQEIFSSDGHLEVPPSIDENNVPTPPSAEAAGSQLSMLSVNDMDIEDDDAPAFDNDGSGGPEVPIITLDPVRNTPYEEPASFLGPFGADAMDSGPESNTFVRRQRQRSGAQSHGSASPARPSTAHDGLAGSNPRGFSMGFRADCEKCRTRVPGHMSHFIT